MTFVLPLASVLFSALMQACSSALIKYSTKIKREKPESKKHMVLFAIAMFMYGPAFVLWTYGLSRLNLAVAQPVFSGSMFIFTVLISIFLFREKLQLYKYAGFLAIIGGIVIIAS